MFTFQPKIAVLLVAFLGLVLVETAGVRYLLERQRADALVVNVAGRQRMLSQKMSKHALMVAQGDGGARKGMAASASLFGRSLRGGERERGGGELARVAAELQQLVALFEFEGRQGEGVTSRPEPGARRGRPVQRVNA